MVVTSMVGLVSESHSSSKRIKSAIPASRWVAIYGWVAHGVVVVSLLLRCCVVAIAIASVRPLETIRSALYLEAVDFVVDQVHELQVVAVGAGLHRCVRVHVRV